MPAASPQMPPSGSQCRTPKALAPPGSGREGKEEGSGRKGQRADLKESPIEEKKEVPSEDRREGGKREEGMVGKDGSNPMIPLFSEDQMRQMKETQDQTPWLYSKVKDSEGTVMERPRFVDQEDALLKAKYAEAEQNAAAWKQMAYYEQREKEDMVGWMKQMAEENEELRKRLLKLEEDRGGQSDGRFSTPQAHSEEAASPPKEEGGYLRGKRAVEDGRPPKEAARPPEEERKGKIEYMSQWKKMEVGTQGGVEWRFSMTQCYEEWRKGRITAEGPGRRDRGETREEGQWWSPKEEDRGVRRFPEGFKEDGPESQQARRREAQEDSRAMKIPRPTERWE